MDCTAIRPAADAYVFTNHAVTRMDTRLIKRETVGCVLAHGDRRVHAGSGVLALSLSRRRLERLRESGLPGALLERAAKVVVLIAGDSPVVITVLRDEGDEARRYRRPMKSHGPRRRYH